MRTIYYHHIFPISNVDLYVFCACRCLIDARLTGSHSRFMPRTVDNKLQFQLEAFKFQAVDNGIVSM